MSLRRAPISVFMAMTPMFFSPRLVEHGRQIRLDRDEMEGVLELGDQIGILAET